jgi:hypothetical protein
MGGAKHEPTRDELRREIGLEHVSSYFGVLPGVLGLMARADELVLAAAVVILVAGYLSYTSKRKWLGMTLLTVVLSSAAYFGLGYLLGLAGYDLPHVAEPTYDLIAYGIVFGAVVSKLEQGIGNLVLAADAILHDGL